MTSEIVSYERINENQHMPMFKCNAEGCTELYRGTTPTNHTITKFVDKENGTHSDRCELCGYEVVKEHRYEEENQSTYSGRVASTSNLYVLRLAKETEDPACLDCGALASAAENGCEHSYIQKNNETQHWEECTNCGYYKEGSLQGHGFTTYKDNEDGTHSSTCEVCKCKLTKNHYYEDGVCIECKASLQVCEHEYVVESDKTNHWAKCSKCNDKGTEEEHIYTNENGEETTRCTVCNYALNNDNDQENNTPDEDEDNKQENNKPGENEDNKQEDNNSDKNQDETEDDKKDNTTTDKILPDTGISKIIALVIIVLSVSIGITIFKLKKYKGI